MVPSAISTQTVLTYHGIGHHHVTFLLPSILGISRSYGGENAEMLAIVANEFASSWRLSIGVILHANVHIRVFLVVSLMRCGW